MKPFSKVERNVKEIAQQQILEGKIGIMPTDTVYGIVCSAFDKVAVDLIYRIKERDTTKPPVIIIGDQSDLEKFDIKIDQNINNIIEKYWPGPVSIIFEGGSFPEYLHRGRGSVPIRLPNDSDLRDFLKVTGPLATSSANPESKPIAKTISEAKNYFESQSGVCFYVDAGEIPGKPSTIIKVSADGTDITQIR